MRIRLRLRHTLTIELDPPCSHWLGDVLEVLLADIVEADLDLAPNLSISVIRYANAARLGNTLQPSSDIDSVAKDIVVVNDDITNMDADAEFNSDILRDVGILRSHCALDFDGAAGGIDCAGEFHEHAVTCCLDDAASMGS